ncbi:hypothetical protein K461DRAFT_316401 [Myriangium duriaei CBS 260.36]|uniref:Ig-like domain-containing protein n=1 Tax=Myriangium duriaei CBS 260.36 TaxID=1168546 RepID=A0A9P4MFH2_9PEZI|nr:hypothetical protein K461DRAFT_316401 [Myriangium duriaei CBS 260.36]
MYSRCLAMAKLAMLLTLLLNFASAATIKDTCSTADVTYVKSQLASPVYFCTFYTARGRVLSPFTNLNKDKTYSACTCIKDSSPAASKPKLLPAPTGGYGPDKTCFASDIAVLKKEFVNPMPFCNFYSAWSSTNDPNTPISSLTGLRTYHACQCLLKKIPVPITTTTTTTRRPTTTTTTIKKATTTATTTRKPSTTTTTTKKTTTTSTTTKKPATTTTTTKKTTTNTLTTTKDTTSTTTTVTSAATSATTTIAPAFSPKALELKTSNANVGASVYAFYSFAYSGTKLATWARTNTVDLDSDLAPSEAASSCATYAAAHQWTTDITPFEIWENADTTWGCAWNADKAKGATAYTEDPGNLVCVIGFDQIEFQTRSEAPNPTSITFTSSTTTTFEPTTTTITTTSAAITTIMTSPSTTTIPTTSAITTTATTSSIAATTTTTTTTPVFSPAALSFQGSNSIVGASVTASYNFGYSGSSLATWARTASYAMGSGYAKFAAVSKCASYAALHQPDTQLTPFEIWENPDTTWVCAWHADASTGAAAYTVNGGNLLCVIGFDQVSFQTQSTTTTTTTTTAATTTTTISSTTITPVSTMTTTTTNPCPMAVTTLFYSSTYAPSATGWYDVSFTLSTYYSGSGLIGPAGATITKTAIGSAVVATNAVSSCASIAINNQVSSSQTFVYNLQSNADGSWNCLVLDSSKGSLVWQAGAMKCSWGYMETEFNENFGD